MSAGLALITIRNLSKRFDNGTLALADVDLDVRDGEFLALLGPSGCGKSTLLRLIAGLVAPTSGIVRHAQPLRERSEIGFVFQEPTLMPWATTLRNTSLPLRLTGVAASEADARAADMLALVGLRGFEQAYPRELSGGMRMRASIARALVTHPRLLLMDEPFAALDEITRQRLNDDLLALWAEQRFTTVFVTHSVFESAYLAQRIAIMAARPGRITAELPIPVPYPRSADVRTSSEYAKLCRSATAALTEAMAA